MHLHRAMAIFILNKTSRLEPKSQKRVESAFISAKAVMFLYTKVSLSLHRGFSPFNPVMRYFSFSPPLKAFYQELFRSHIPPGVLLAVLQAISHEENLAGLSSTPSICQSLFPR